MNIRFQFNSRKIVFKKINKTTLFEQNCETVEIYNCETVISEKNNVK